MNKNIGLDYLSKYNLHLQPAEVSYIMALYYLGNHTFDVCYSWVQD